MKADAYPSKEVDKLALLASDGALDKDQTIIFRDMIMNDPIARRRITRSFYLQSCLGEELKSLELVNIQPKKVQLTMRLAAIAVLILAVVIVFFVLPKTGQNDTEPTMAIGITKNKNVAVISKHVDVVWGNDTSLKKSKRKSQIPLEPCIIEIESGLVQIDFFHGATVLLEGPSKFQVINSEQGRLIHGKLCADVPPPAIGFEILTGGFKVVDLGTSFGMSVDYDGSGEVHVFDGEVEVWHPEEDKQILLQQGQSISIRGNSVVVGKSRSQVFTRSESLDYKVERKITESNQLSKQLIEDEDVVLYYTFSGADHWARKVKNKATHGRKGTDGAIVGCHTTQGRWPGKQALGFNSSSDRVRLNLPGKFKDITMITWVKMKDVLGENLALLNPETEQDHFLHWSIISSKTKELQQLHFSETSQAKGLIRGRTHYHCNKNLHQQLLSGEWTHLALVYDTQRGKVNHYVNGKLVGTNDIKKVSPLKVGIADIGNWPQKEWAKGTKFEIRHLVGSMSKFLIAKRAFSETEIRHIYETEKP